MNHIKCGCKVVSYSTFHAGNTAVKYIFQRVTIKCMPFKLVQSYKSSSNRWTDTRERDNGWTT